MTNKEKFNEVFKETFGYTPENCFPCPEKCPEKFADSCCDACPYARFATKEYKKPKKKLERNYSELRIEVAKIAEDLGKVLYAHSPIPENEIVGFICIFLDTLTGDNLPLEFDLICTRSDMAEKIFKEWPHSVEYYKKGEKKE